MWESCRKLNMYEPAVFVIRIQGDLGKNWAEYFSSQSVSIHLDPAGNTITTLITEPMDQAALVGLVNYLNSVGMPLISVAYQEEK